MFDACIEFTVNEKSSLETTWTASVKALLALLKLSGGPFFGFCSGFIIQELTVRMTASKMSQKENTKLCSWAYWERILTSAEVSKETENWEELPAGKIVNC